MSLFFVAVRCGPWGISARFLNERYSNYTVSALYTVPTPTPGTQDSCRAIHCIHAPSPRCHARLGLAHDRADTSHMLSDFSRVSEATCEEVPGKSNQISDFNQRVRACSSLLACPAQLSAPQRRSLRQWLPIGSPPSRAPQRPRSSYRPESIPDP